jgi:hypothetical protein
MEVGTVVVTVQTYGTFHSIWVRRSGAEVSMPLQNCDEGSLKPPCPSPRGE